ncbi:MAG: hypothetical protein B5M51_01325 [Anaerolinea sp. 4484_236]|nr:MAG: hypothetical protein B5M51_01325 [Anaerolinea sp. 4484_236]
MKKLNILILLIIVISLFAAMPVSAQGGDDEISDDEVNAIARDLFCPVCENTPLDVCETQACKQWRELIRLKLSEGWSKEEIEQYFVDNYGARVLDEPPAEGFNLLVYFVPPAIILIGVVILFRAFRQWKDEDESKEDVPETEASLTHASEAINPSEDYLAKFEEELRKRK